MDEIAGSENRITIARENMNSAISNYNTKVKSFPTSIDASMLGYTEITMYNAPIEKQEVKVKFDNTILIIQYNI